MSKLKKSTKIILLAGPTGSGKSRFAVHLAKYIGGEIINTDSMQVYKEFTILTSRPKLKDYKNIKHHLYGIKSVHEHFSTGQWLNLCSKKIQECLNRKKIPILVGGTGLYFKSLLEGLVSIPKIPDELRNNARILHKKIGQKEFYKKLIKIDPTVKKKINENDIQRTLRAFEVKKYTKKSLFTWIKKTKPKFKKEFFKKFFLNTPKTLLINKINDRVEQMFKQNAVKEVESFIKKRQIENFSSYKIIGIKEIEVYLNNLSTQEEAKNLIKIKTRQYAKRQFTWSRGQMKSWNKVFYQNNNILLKKVVSLLS